MSDNFEPPASTVETKLSGDSSDSNDDCCPICLSKPCDDLSFATSGSCSHSFCVPCIERLLLTTSGRISSSQELPPTVGLCPICRCEMKYFELKRADDPTRLLVTPNHDITGSPLAGKEFEGRSIKIVFPKEGDTDQSLPMVRVLVDSTGDTESVYYPFDAGSSYHQKTNTFHGTVTFPTDDTTSNPPLYSRWDIILQFAADFRFISNGAIVKYHFENFHPLDGSWRVTWLHSGLSARLEVTASEWDLYTYHYRLTYPENKQQCIFVWPGDWGQVVQTVDYDFTANPAGPAVGESLEWRTTHPVQKQIRWTRLIVQEAPENTTELVGPGPYRSLFRLVNNSGNQDSRNPPSYQQTQLWGNTFCQGLKVGLASYHFLEDETAYISYEHPDTGRWPPLDDGSPIPPRVMFRDTEWNVQERTFRGKIRWYDDYGTTWQACRQWNYEMTFDTEFTFILSGSVRSLTSFQDDPVEMSTFGFDLNYINAAFPNKLKNLFGEESDATARRQIVQNQVVQRARTEGATVRTLAMIQHVCTRAALASSSSNMDDDDDDDNGMDEIIDHNLD